MGRVGRSPERGDRRRRSKSREWERDFEKRRKLGHEKDRRPRSRSPLDRSYDRIDRDSRRHDERRYNRRSFSRSPSSEARGGVSSKKNKFVAPRPKVTEADLKDKTPDEQEMMKAMGFCGFDSTKGKKVDNNDSGAVHVILKRKYRQYMNRKGGFNRPLDFVA
uniref:U4/U6.U5 small nuclear ribonucleoprotein 27 kDa protein n=1 Tax=Cacopsylla melanoneura TaxID=428564 RepID=A0A8D8V179_9HEMI